MTAKPTVGAADRAPAKAPDARAGAPAPVWRQDDGAPVSCLEKIKVLNDNYAELQQMAQDAFEDALLIGCSEAQVRAALRGLVDGLINPYPGTKEDPSGDRGRS
jgi:hypothetical protein